MLSSLGLGLNSDFEVKLKSDETERCVVGLLEFSSWGSVGLEFSSSRLVGGRMRATTSALGTFALNLGEVTCIVLYR